MVRLGRVPWSVFVLEADIECLNRANSRHFIARSPECVGTEFGLKSSEVIGDKGAEGLQHLFRTLEIYIPPIFSGRLRTTPKAIQSVGTWNARRNTSGESPFGRNRIQEHFSALNPAPFAARL